MTATPTTKRTPTVSLLAKLVSISKATRTLMGYKLAEIGIHPGQDELLLTLARDTPQSVTHLADVLKVRAPSVSRMLDRLAESGLVERVPDATDDRRTVVRITPAGTQMQCRIREVWQALENEFQEMPDRDRAQKDLGLVKDVLSTRLRRLR
ncbi:MAG: MarR family transcriptional regulator [Aurantimonas endophytica]|uniref:MarR family winged helix-turn-helix transcriptional regulator n=1 Tax=Aurantimonas endophytica TaxID=1522175 RepID=UPI003001D4E7